MSRNRNIIASVTTNLNNLLPEKSALPLKHKRTENMGRWEMGVEETAAMTTAGTFLRVLKAGADFSQCLSYSRVADKSIKSFCMN